jgi:hypothetical protein
MPILKYSCVSSVIVNPSLTPPLFIVAKDEIKQLGELHFLILLWESLIDKMEARREAQLVPIIMPVENHGQ